MGSPLPPTATYASLAHHPILRVLDILLPPELPPYGNDDYTGEQYVDFTDHEVIKDRFLHGMQKLVGMTLFSFIYVLLVLMVVVLIYVRVS